MQEAGKPEVSPILPLPASCVLPTTICDWRMFHSLDWMRSARVRKLVTPCIS